MGLFLFIPETKVVIAKVFLVDVNGLFSWYVAHVVITAYAY